MTQNEWLSTKPHQESQLSPPAGNQKNAVLRYINFIFHLPIWKPCPSFILSKATTGYKIFTPLMNMLTLKKVIAKKESFKIKNIRIKKEITYKRIQTISLYVSLKSLLQLHHSTQVKWCDWIGNKQDFCRLNYTKAVYPQTNTGRVPFGRLFVTPTWIRACFEIAATQRESRKSHNRCKERFMAQIDPSEEINELADSEMFSLFVFRAFQHAWQWHPVQPFLLLLHSTHNGWDLVGSFF